VPVYIEVDIYIWRSYPKRVIIALKLKVPSKVVRVNRQSHTSDLELLSHQDLPNSIHQSGRVTPHKKWRQLKRHLPPLRRPIGTAQAEIRM
jgi:hypothetical protein